MQYDRKITICTAGSRKAAYWPAQELYLAELWEKLKVPARGTETMAEYLAMKKPRQDELKDVGGYVPEPWKRQAQSRGRLLAET